jgi:5-methylthioadenosine/S-adenosylhomocysteine deaminase
MANETSRPQRGSYLVKGGAVISVDPALGTLPRADILVRDGAIVSVGPALSANDAEIIDASRMIVMPGMVDSHYHMWSTLGRNFLSDNGFEYFPAKWATAGLYGVDDFHNSVSLGLAELAFGGVTTVHNWSHNNRSPQHVDAELQAHRNSLLRARYSLGHVDRMPPDIVNTFGDLDRVQREWFDDSSRLDGLVRLGVNLRGMVQSDAAVFHAEMQDMLKRKIPVCIHASQSQPNSDDAADYEKRGYLGPNFLFCHYIAASDGDRAAMARTRTPLSFSTHSELRLGEHGDPRSALLKARAAGVTVTLSSDATSIAPPNMFENMRFTWNMGIPWKQTDTEKLPPVGFAEVIEMATINGARALGLGDVTGSLTPGKRADLILIRTTDLNIAPLAQIEATVVLSATPANVDTVMVDGRILKRDGKLLHCDVPGIVERAERSAWRIRHAAGGALKPVSEAPGNPVYRGAC